MDYEILGVGYASHRLPDPRIAQRLHAALAGTGAVLNVGAGTGSYEPAGRCVVALEPSWRMLQQRGAGAAPVVQGAAEELPFADGRFAVAMAVLTIHHWRDWRRGLAEMQRVAARQVLLTWDPAHAGFWLVDEYFPELRVYDRRIFPSIDVLCSELGGAEVHEVPIPHDCRDGFLGAYWRRPAAYLDPEVRRSISSFARIPDSRAGLLRLQQDLDNGAWHRRQGPLLACEALDLGYRLVVRR